MPKIIIDNKEYQVEGKPTILQAAQQVGVEIPHFCYHPGLSISGNCRMCLVEAGTPKMGPGGIETDENGNPIMMWMPKPITSCSTPVSEGMTVKTHHTSPIIEEAQKGVLEFILINHPLDCPICDQAGECPLQENTFKFGPEGSRFEFEKNHKPKRVELGPNVTFDAERCINCTRCVRFCDEVAQSSQLTVIERGDHNYIATFPGMKLDNPYAMNTIDICPVGALTSSDFRFKARVWEMSDTDSICTGCSNGCSTKYWVRNNEILRMTPRENPQVNQWWMCDEGRLGFGYMNENRVNGAYERVNQEFCPLSWEKISTVLAEKFSQVSPEQIGIVLSPFATLEDSFASIEFFKAFGVKNFTRFKNESGENDHLLIKKDKSPNQKSLDLLEPLIGQFIPSAEFQNLISSNKIKHLIILEDNPFKQHLSVDILRDLTSLITFTSNWTETAKLSHLVIPTPTVAETIGSFINEKGIIQRVKPAKVLKHQNRSLMRETGKSRWDKHATKYDNWAQDTFVTDAKPTWEILMDISSKTDHQLMFKSPSHIFDQAVKIVSDLSELSYDKIGIYGAKISTIVQEEKV